MDDKINPFTPTFGKVPPLFAGRKYIIKDVLEGLQAGPGNPNRASLFVGARGSGKTALLVKIANEASQRGWISARVTAVPGMLEDILERTYAAGNSFLAEGAESKITGLSVAGFGVTREVKSKPLGNWRTQMNAVLDVLERHSIGLLITVDEVKNTDEMRLLAATFQHLVSEEREVVLLMAGLPQNASALLSDESVSFLRRAASHQLGAIHEPYEVRETIQKTIELSGRTIDETALEEATIATGGFPFLIQLVGYHIWRQSPSKNMISESDVTKGIRYAQEDMENRILKLTVSELSDRDVQFLLAMLQDDEISQLSAIAERLGVSLTYAGQYRLRLIEQGIIGARGRGKLGFDLPMLKDYLKRTHSVKG